MECHAKQEAPLKKYPRPSPWPSMEKEGKIGLKSNKLEGQIGTSSSWMIIIY
jgi:hypothetical protein